MEKLKCQVVMLPTEKATEGGIHTMPNETLQISKRETLGNKIFEVGVSATAYIGSYQPQHLYFVQLVENIETIDQTELLVFISSNEMIETITTANRRIKTIGEYYKIIATTDASLNLPLIGEAFVAKYAKLQGDISEVLINVEEYTETTYGNGIDISYPAVKPIIRHDNTVIISTVKSSWGREDIKALFVKFAEEVDNAYRPYTSDNFRAGELLNEGQFLKHNL